MWISNVLEIFRSDLADTGVDDDESGDDDLSLAEKVLELVKRPIGATAKDS